jgi:hypothetical protein
MPLIISSILGALLSLMGSLIGRALLALGLGFIEFKGISLLLTKVTDYAGQALGGFAGSNMVAWAGFFQIDVHVSIILSAIGVKMALNSLNGSTIRKLVQK